MEKRYSKNLGALTAEEMRQLKTKCVFVAGCGGLGGYCIEMLGRLGIGGLTVADGDSFEKTNLNRQLLSSESNLGQSKALAAKQRLSEINSLLTVRALAVNINESNAEELLAGHDLAVDALDSTEARRILAGGCEKLGIPLVHGAISGWRAQISVLIPGGGGLDSIYPPGVRVQAGSSLSFTPALAAAIQAAECAKLLCGRGELLESRLLLVDLLTQEYNIITL